MNNHITILGFGVIGTEALSHLLKKKVKKKLTISVIEKDFSNIPGGIAYSKIKSKYGFFNNPLRLSNVEFINWIKKKNDNREIYNFANNYQDFDLHDWIQKNLNKNYQIKDINEIYLPRFFYSLFLREKLLKIFSVLRKNKKINLKFYKGEIIRIEKQNNIFCYPKNKLVLNNFKIKNNDISFNDVKNKRLKVLKSKHLVIGNGVLPPKKILTDKKFSNKNYIHDFYASGGTVHLLKKIKILSKKEKNLKLVFIGNKAGLLEPIQQLEKLFERIPTKIKLISISSNKLTLEKAELSDNYKRYKFILFTKPNILKVKKSSEILYMLKKEFEIAKTKDFNKYDVWTLMLKKNLIDKCFSRLSVQEKLNYNNITFNKIRNLTRYTYPETVKSKNRMIKKKLLYFLKDKVSKLVMNKKFIDVITKNKKKIKANIVINVSGPVPLNNINTEVQFITSLKRVTKNFNNRGFISNNNFEIGGNIYIPGTLSSNFNPNRKTIIKSIISNTVKSINHYVRMNKLI